MQLFKTDVQKNSQGFAVQVNMMPLTGLIKGGTMSAFTHFVSYLINANLDLFCSLSPAHLLCVIAFFRAILINDRFIRGLPVLQGRGFKGIHHSSLFFGGEGIKFPNWLGLDAKIIFPPPTNLLSPQ